jgi:hypothetical protein
MAGDKRLPGELVRESKWGSGRATISYNEETTKKLPVLYVTWQTRDPLVKLLDK